MLKQLLITCVSALCIISCTDVKKQSTDPYQSTTQTDVEALYKKTKVEMPQVKVPSFPEMTVNIQSFGAQGNGIFMNTEAIQAAIDNVCEAGGGTVVIPAGVWMTGPIVLKNNVRLYTEPCALIVFSPNYKDYPIIETSFEGVDTKRCQSPISARGAKNIAITGHGTFNGSGDAWRPVKKSKVTGNQWKGFLSRGGVVNEKGDMWFPYESSLYGQSLCIDQNVPANVKDNEWEEIHSFLRPVMVSFIECDGILLEGVTFENSPAWNIHPLMSNNIIINNLTVRNPWYSQNGDGIDIESCSNTLIINSNFDVGDDAICMKSGKNEDGRKRGIPTENVLVNNCTVYHGHGGFVVGSEMSGDIRNIYVENCVFIGTDVGLRFKSTRGRGGIVENIHIQNIYMKDIPTDPLLFDLFYGGKGAGEETEEEIMARMQADIPPVSIETPQFKDIYIKNVTCAGAKRAMLFNGLPEMKIKNVQLDSIFIQATYGAEINQTDGIVIKNTQIVNEKGKPFTMRMVENVTYENITDANGNQINL